MAEKFFKFSYLFIFITFTINNKIYGQKTNLEKDLDYFWGEKRKLEVIQKRVFLKDGRHEFTIFSGTIPNDDFFVYLPAGLRYNYYFSEDWAFELNGAYLFEFNSNLEDFLETNQVIRVDVYLPERLKWYTNVDIVWSLIHGKFAFLTNLFAHFDLSFAFGAGIIGLKILKAKEEKNELSPVFNLGVGAKVYLNDWLALRIDYRNFFYKSDEYNGMSYPAEITFGLSFFSKAPK